MELARALAALCAAVLCCGPALAQERVPGDRTEITLSFAPVVRAVAPAVVNIYTRKVVKVRSRPNPFADDPFFQQFFGRQFGFSVPRERIERALGSGVVIAPEGVIVTNAHVIEGADEVTVVLADRREFPAKIVGSDSRTDIAVLRIDPKGHPLPALAFGDADALQVGDLVLAIGNPFGFNQTVTSGIVSALARTSVGVNDYGFFIQTDAAINPGNSGGALVDMKGRLVGLNSAIYSRGGAGSIGIGFAIPSQMVQAVSRSILAHGRAVRPWFGASGDTVTAEMAESLGLDRPRGTVLADIYPGSPAAAAGLKSGDVVLAVDGREVADAAGLRFRLATVPVGGETTLSVLHQGRTETVRVTLIEPPDAPPRDATTVAGRNPLTGAEIANLNPALADETGLPLEGGGVVVLKVKDGSIADRLGFQPGDRLKAVNGRHVGTVAQALPALKTVKGGWRIDINRDGKAMSINVEG